MNILRGSWNGWLLCCRFADSHRHNKVVRARVTLEEVSCIFNVAFIDFIESLLHTYVVGQVEDIC